MMNNSDAQKLTIEDKDNFSCKKHEWSKEAIHTQTHTNITNIIKYFLKECIEYHLITLKQKIKKNSS